MEPFQRDTPRNVALPTIFRKGKRYGLYLLWIFALSSSFSAACDNELSDNDCLQMSISVEEGESVEVPLSASEIIQDLCIWNNATSLWENGCHFSNGVCQTLIIDFKEDVSMKGNKFELKSVSHKASGLYRLLNKSGRCIASMQISVLSTKPTTTSSSGSFDIRLGKWSGVTWLCSLATIPILAIFSYL